MFLYLCKNSSFLKEDESFYILKNAINLKYELRFTLNGSTTILGKVSYFSNPSSYILMIPY